MRIPKLSRMALISAIAFVLPVVIFLACLTLGLILGSTKWLVVGAVLMTAFTLIFWVAVTIFSRLATSDAVIGNWLRENLHINATAESTKVFIRTLVCVFGWLLVANIYIIVLDVWRSPLHFLLMIVVWFAMLYVKFAYQLSGLIFRNLAIIFIVIMLVIGTLNFAKDNPEIRSVYSGVVRTMSSWFATKPASKTTSSGTTTPVVPLPPVATASLKTVTQTRYTRKKMKPSRVFLDAKMDVQEWVDYVDREFTDIRE